MALRGALGVGMVSGQALGVWRSPGSVCGCIEALGVGVAHQEALKEPCEMGMVVLRSFRSGCGH